VLKNRSEKLNVALGCCNTMLNRLKSNPVQGVNTAADVCEMPNLTTGSWVYFSHVQEKSPFPQMLCKQGSHFCTTGGVFSPPLTLVSSPAIRNQI